MSCTFWNMRRRKVAETKKAAVAPETANAKTAAPVADTGKKAVKKGGGKDGK